MRRGFSIGAVGLALGIAGCGGSSHASSAAAGSGASGSGASGSGGAVTTSASRSGSGSASASASAPANKPGHAVKPHRRHVYNRPAQVVAGTGGVIVPAVHITLAPAAPAAPAARPAFLSAADAVCRSYRSEVAAEGVAGTLPAQEKVYVTVVDDATRAIVRLQRLSPPAAARPLFLRYLALTGGAIDDFAIAQRRSRSTSEKDGTSVEGGDFSAFQVLARRVTAARAVAHQLGLRVCGSAGSDWL
jgi:hypothetical protein